MKKSLIIAGIILNYCNPITAQNSLPYYNNFETDTIGWYSETAFGSTFQLDSTNFIGCVGSKGFGLGFDTLGTFTVLYSPWFDFSNVSTASLCINHKYFALLNQDGIRLEYTIDNSVWNIVGNTLQGTNWYNASFISSSALPAWTGTAANCISSSIPLDFLIGLNSVQFRFVPNFTDTVDKYFIDDFRICISPCLCNNTVDIVEHDPKINFSIYPIPANNWFIIETDSFDNIEFSIYNSTNQLVYEGKLNRSTTVNSNSFTPGIYYIRLINHKKCVIEKIIITSNWHSK